MKNERMRQAVDSVTNSYFFLFPNPYYPSTESRHNYLPSKNGVSIVDKECLWEYTARVYRYNNSTGVADIFEESGVVLSPAASDDDCVDTAKFNIQRWYSKCHKGVASITSCWLVRDRLITAPEVTPTDAYFSLGDSRVAILNTIPLTLPAS